MRAIRSVNSSMRGGLALLSRNRLFRRVMRPVFVAGAAEQMNRASSIEVLVKRR